MQATAVAHPIQGLVKYHGMRDPDRRYPFHDSISVCTAPARTETTVTIDPDLAADEYVVDGDRLTGRAAERLGRVVDAIRDGTEVEGTPVRLESENTFPANVGLGSSSSGMAAAAVAMAAAAGLPIDRRTLSGYARLGSASAARSVTGGFSVLPGGADEETCRSYRLESPLEEELRIVVAMIDAYKETEDAHREAPASHMFEGRLAHVHDQLAAVRAGLTEGDFEGTFERVEADSLSLAATTMTGPRGWIYWQPTTLEVFERVRELRRERAVPAYFSTDTGASVYVNTTREHVDVVKGAIEDLDLAALDTWEVGGPARVTSDEQLV